MGARHDKSPPVTFGGCKYFGSGDMFSVVEEQDSTCSLNFVIIIFLLSRWQVMVTHTKFHNKDKLGGNIYVSNERGSIVVTSLLTKYGT